LRPTPQFSGGVTVIVVYGYYQIGNNQSRRSASARRRAALPYHASQLSERPNAAQLYREQIKLGLQGEPRAALKARVIVRKLLNDEVLIEQDDDGSVWARYSLNPTALIAAGCRKVGAQESVCSIPTVPMRTRVR
jgi:hypothetical protein